MTRPDVLNDLKASEDEVDDIFSHPLEAILDPSISSKEPLSAVGSEHWPYEDSEYYVRVSFRVKLPVLTGVSTEHQRLCGRYSWQHDLPYASIP